MICKKVKYMFFNMIRLIQQGKYTLIETHRHTKILHLNNKGVFAWIAAGKIGEILVSSHKTHKTDRILATGKYRIYEVKNDLKFTDLIHLELLAGEGVWQGYLLPTGLPTNNKKRNRIIPTDEIITKSTN